jgi:hypothetical protein
MNFIGSTTCNSGAPNFFLAGRYTASKLATFGWLFLFLAHKETLEFLIIMDLESAYLRLRDFCTELSKESRRGAVVKV